MLRCLFSNPVYKGSYAYGKHHNEYRAVPREKWLVRQHAFPAIITDEQWQQAYERVVEETRRPEDGEMLDGLRRVWKRNGKLSSDIINASRDIPSAVAYGKHFGGINEAYKLIGYPLIHDLSWGHAVRLTRRINKTLCDEICERVREIGGSAELMSTCGMIRLNGNVTVKIALRKCWVREERAVWVLPLGKSSLADVLIVGRLKPPERSIMDYFVLPALSQLHGGLRSRARKSVDYLELYHFQTLQPFIETFRRFSLQETT